MARKRNGYALGGEASSEPTEADLKAQGMPTFSDPPPPVSEPPGALQSLFSNGVNFIRGLDRGFSQNIGAMAGSSPLDLAKNIGSGLIEPFRVFHDTATGKMNPMDHGPGTDRAIGLGFDIATSAAGLPGEPGVLGMFAGRKAKTFPLKDTYEARKMLKDAGHYGQPTGYLDVERELSPRMAAAPDEVRRDIWQKTGFDVNREGKPMFEIDDSTSVYHGKKEPPNRPDKNDPKYRNPDGTTNWGLYGPDFQAWDEARKLSSSGQPLTAKDVLDHPDLYAAYPDVGDIPIDYKHGMQAHERGAYDIGQNRIHLNPGMSPQEQHSTLLHELQHAVQAREGWQGGANIETGQSLANEARNHMDSAEGMIEFYDLLKNGASERKIRNMMARGKVTGGERELKMAKDIFAMPDGDAVANGVYQEMLRRMNDRRDPFQNYQRVEGEVQARNTQTRQILDPESRRWTYWKGSEDYGAKPRFNPGGSGSFDELQYAEGGMVNQGARARLMAHLERGGRAKKPKVPKSETVYADPNPALNPASLKVIEARRQEMLKDKKDRLQPTGENLFEDSTDAYRRTTDLVPQYDNADRIPAPPEGKDVPRLRPLVEHREEMARRLASEMEPGLKTTAPYFYNVGPIHERNIASGMSPEESISNLRALGPYMGATSSKTPTDQNVLNATLLRTFDTQGLPYQGGDSANLRGYNMMGSHLKSAAKYRDNGVDPMQQPKHDSYSENFSGNLMPTTTDSHDSKSTLLMMNRIEPGSVHDIYIHPKERERYREDPSSLTGDMLTGMIPGGTIDKGQGSRPYDYTPLSAVTRRTSELLGIHPAEGQSLKWFTFGDQTGLKSPPKTLVQLLNERINITAQVLGEPPEKVWKMVQAGEIPLMKKGGRVKC